MKKLITLLLTVMSINCFAQVIFIGQTKAQVRKYWAAKMPDDCFFEGKWDDTHEDYFIIQYRGGQVNFSATFDEKGICKTHTKLVRSEDFNSVMEKMEKSGYVYDEKLDGYLDAKRKYIWTLVEVLGDNVEFTCKRYFPQK